MTDNINQGEPGLQHRFGVAVDGLNKGVITTLSIPGLLVDAANHAPKIINILPGDQGFRVFADEPFMGSAWIKRNLTGLYHGYNDLVGYDVPDRVDLTDHLVGIGGELTGGALVTGGVSMAANSSATLTNILNRSAAGVTALGESSVMQGALRTAWWGARNPVLTATGVTAADVTLNDGDLTGGLVSSGLDWGTEKVTGYPGVGDAWEKVAPPEMQEALDSFMVYMGENPELAKWGSFGVALLVGNSLIEGLVGNQMFGGLISLVLAGAIAWGLSDAFKGAAVNSYNESLDFSAHRNARPQAPAPMMPQPVPAM